MSREIIFFIGTEAEFIKLFPVIIECQKRNKICNIVASGQNDLKKSRILDFIELNGKFLELSNEKEISKSTMGLLRWFFKTIMRAERIIKEEFKNYIFTEIPVVVHGDTISTLMGAWIGKKLGAKVYHVEAGLRSHNLFNPFPEEIDRLLTSKLANVHFAPDKTAVCNLSKAKGKVINTEYNTILDSLEFSKEISLVTEEVKKIINTRYFVFVMHRQENLANKEFFKSVLDKVNQLSKEIECVFIMHKITENALIEMNEMEKIKENQQFVLLPRVDYFDFMKLLENAEFIITDGGSNQEELHYMGKPCLIMRKNTERYDGIGTNALLYNGDTNSIIDFGKNYGNYKKRPIKPQSYPSNIIADNI